MSSCHPQLAHLTTWWGCLDAAHHAPADAARAALARLVDRYRGAVDRYLMAALGDRDAADDVFQEFALRLAGGAFRGATPERGRFRDYLRAVLIRLVRDHRRRATAAPPTGLPADPAAPPDEDLFRTSWLEDLFERGWRALQHAEATTGRPLRTALWLKTAVPGIRSADIAGRLSAPGRPVTDLRVRQHLTEARTRFAAAVIAEVAGTLRRPTPDAVAEELADLGLLQHEHFRSALTRWAAR